MKVYSIYSPVSKQYINTQIKTYWDRYTNTPMKIYADRTSAERAIKRIHPKVRTYSGVVLAQWQIVEHELSNVL